jgi:hypothetical protein
MRREDLAGVELDDGDVVVVGEREDAFARVGGADAEVVHAAGAAEAHLVFGVEPVVAQAVVAGLVAVAGRGRFRGRAVGVARGSAVQRAVWAVLVVVLAELVELALELVAVRAMGLARSQRWRVWWNRSVFPWVWGWPAEPFFWRTPRIGRRYSKALRPPVNREV